MKFSYHDIAYDTHIIYLILLTSYKKYVNFLIKDILLDWHIMQGLKFVSLIVLYMVIFLSNSSARTITVLLSDLIKGKIYVDANDVSLNSPTGKDVSSLQGCQLTTTSGENCKAYAGDNLLIKSANIRLGTLYQSGVYGLAIGFISVDKSKLYVYCGIQRNWGSDYISPLQIVLPNDPGDYNIFLANIKSLNDNSIPCNPEPKTTDTNYITSKLDFINSRMISTQTNSSESYNLANKVVLKIFAPSCPADVSSNMNWPSTYVYKDINLGMSRITADNGSFCTNGTGFNGTTTRDCVALGDGTATWLTPEGNGCTNQCIGFTQGGVIFPSIPNDGNYYEYGVGRSDVCEDSSKVLTKAFVLRCTYNDGNANLMTIYKNTSINTKAAVQTSESNDSVTISSNFPCYKPTNDPNLPNGEWTQYHTDGTTNLLSGFTYFSFDGGNPTATGITPNDGDKIHYWIDTVGLYKADVSAANAKYASFQGGAVEFFQSVSFVPFTWDNYNLRNLNSRNFRIMMVARNYQPSPVSSSWDPDVTLFRYRAGKDNSGNDNNFVADFRCYFSGFSTGQNVGGTICTPRYLYWGSIYNETGSAKSVYSALDAMRPITSGYSAGGSADTYTKNLYLKTNTPTSQPNFYSMSDSTYRYGLAANFPDGGKYSFLYSAAFNMPFMGAYTNYMDKYPGSFNTSTGFLYSKYSDSNPGMTFGDPYNNIVYHIVAGYKRSSATLWDMSEGYDSTTCANHNGSCSEGDAQKKLIGDLYHSLKIRDQWASRFGYTDDYRHNCYSPACSKANTNLMPPVICYFQGADWLTCDYSTTY